MLAWDTVEIGSLDEEAKTLWGRVELDTGNPELRKVLAKLMQRAKVPGRDPRALALAVQKLIQTHIKFLREYPETFVRPVLTLAWRVGDCDDQASALCALLRSAKIPCRLVLCGFRVQGEEDKPRHVYAEALLPLEPPGSSDSEWVPLETVRKVPPGWRAEDRWRAQGKQPLRWTYGDKGPL
jgi:transglutaminase-like putative cysteine protease